MAKKNAKKAETKTNNPPDGYVGSENAQQVRTIRGGRGSVIGNQ